MDKKHYYVQNGKLIKAADRAVPKILVGSADDLELIKDKVTPGSEAHTPGYANIWELSPERKWKSKVFADEDRLYDELVKMQFSEITADVKSIGSYAFDSQPNLVKAVFPECEMIGPYAFFSCPNLSEISFPKCKEIKNSAFYQCELLPEISFPECEIVGESAFYGCSVLASAALPKCKTIGSYAFGRCPSLSWISCPLCETIESRAFISSGLVSITLPECKAIGANAFSNCLSLTDVYLTSTEMVSAAASPAFNNTVTIHVPSNLAESYRTTAPWSAYSSQFVEV